MRYEDFRDRWQAALAASRLPLRPMPPDETLDLTTMTRRWATFAHANRPRTLHTDATISFAWNPFHSARSYSCEEDLQTELFGRRPTRPTQPRYVRVDFRLRASLAADSTAPLPAPEVWGHWIPAMETQLDAALALPAPGRRGITAYRGGVEIDARPTPDGTIAFQGLSLPAFELLVVPRLWDDPDRRERERSHEKQIDGLAQRFRAGWDVWIACAAQLEGWLQDPANRRGPGRRRKRGRFPDDEPGPTTTH